MVQKETVQSIRLLVYGDLSEQIETPWYGFSGELSTLAGCNNTDPYAAPVVTASSAIEYAS